MTQKICNKYTIFGFIKNKKKYVKVINDFIVLSQKHKLSDHVQMEDTNNQNYFLLNQ